MSSPQAEAIASIVSKLITAGQEEAAAMLRSSVARAQAAEKSAKLSMTESRRLQLAAEVGHTLGLAVRPWRWPAKASDFAQPTAARTH